ncbi:MAG: hypothetical protein HUJ61_08435, partial [Bacilli bacterium]|nr:hypothetical protein [Bacilli bacterium]
NEYEELNKEKSNLILVIPVIQNNHIDIFKDTRLLDEITKGFHSFYIGIEYYDKGNI